MFNILFILCCLLAACTLFSRAAVDPVVFDCNAVSGIPQTCSNMCFATNCAGAAGLLTFDTRDATVKKNRRNAAGCPRPNRCQGRIDGRITCDEYPFASTAQGGAGSVTRCVSHPECRSQGGTLSTFYRQFDLAIPGQDRDFGIMVTDFANVLYCNDAANCINDGDEFQNGAPVPNHFLPRNTTAGAKPIGPVYVTKSGIRVMSLGTKYEPGTKIFRAHPNVFADAGGCDEGTDETVKREVVLTDDVGIWDEIDHEIDP